MPPPPDLPGWAELTAGAHVVRVPLRCRSGASPCARRCCCGDRPAGGSSPRSSSTATRSAARWLAAAVEAAWVGWPAPVRDWVPVNVTVPAVPAAAVPGVLARFPGCRPPRSRSPRPGQALADDVDRVAAVRDALGPAGRIRVDANGAWSVGDGGRGADRARPVRAGVRRAAVRGRRRAGRAAPRAGRRGAGRRRRERAQGRGPAAGRAGRCGRRGRAQGRAAGRGAGRRCGWPAGCGLPVVVSSRAGHVGGHRRRGRRSPPHCPTCRTPAGWARSGCWPPTSPPMPLTPVAGRLPVRAVAPDPARLAELAAPADRRAWWVDRLRRCHAVLAGS